MSRWTWGTRAGVGLAAAMAACGSSTSGGADGGGGADAGAACATLMQCCVTLPPVVKQQCEMYVMGGNPNICKGLLTSYQCVAADAGAPTGACATLAACCPSLPNAAQCTMYAEMGNQLVCSDTLADLADAGACH